MNKKRKIWERAKETAKDNNKIKNVVSQTANKLKTIATDSEQFQELSSKLGVFIRMVKAHLSGDYRAFSTKTILLIVFALVYFVIPADVIPDFIPALGFSDDISIIYFIYKQIDQDISAFLHWEK